MGREQVYSSEWETSLTGNILSSYLEKRGLSEKIIRRFRIGYDTRSRRYTIPVSNLEGRITAVKLYSPTQEPKMLNVKGSSKSLYPIQSIKWAEQGDGNLILTAGEHDALMAIQYGFNALCLTTGERSLLKDEWLPLFRRVKVFVCYDNDKTGILGSKAICEQLSKADIEVYRMHIKKVCKEKGEDITDFFVKYKKSREDFYELLCEAEKYDGHDDTDVSLGVTADSVDKPVKFRGIVVGKDLSPYQIPKIYRIKCQHITDTKKCEGCPYCYPTPSEEDENGKWANAGYVYKRFSFERPDDRKAILKMVGVNSQTVDNVLLSFFGKKQGCSLVIDVEEYQNIEVLSIIPEPSYGDYESASYALRQAFYFGAHLQTNKSYLFKGVTSPHVGNQSGIYVIHTAIETQDTISRFHLTDDILHQFELFKVKDETAIAVFNKGYTIASDISYNVAHVAGRENLALALLLTYHSPLQFDFRGKRIIKGWLETTVVGDTATGKTELVRAMVRHFRAGDLMTSGENVSLAGILGGLQKSASDQFTVTWGKIPLNDKGLLVLDEAENIIRTGILGHLSGVRSEGIAEITRIQQAKTTARTRMVFVMNPLNGRLSEYSYGIEALKQLFVHQQDIRRIDMAVIVDKREVSDYAIRNQREVPHIFTSELCHASIMQAWNYRPSDIIFEGGAEDACYDEAESIGEKFDASIPVFETKDGVYKIARIAIAFAALLKSNKDGKLIVKDIHAQAASMFLMELYGNGYCGFLRYSEKQKEYEKIDENSLNSIIRNKHEAELLLSLPDITPASVGYIYGLKPVESARKYGLLLKMKTIRVTPSGRSKKTSAFVDYLKKRIEELPRQDFYDYTVYEEIDNNYEEDI